MPDDLPDPQQRWERRDRKLKKRRWSMIQSGAGLKSIILPLLRKKAEKAKRTTEEPTDPAS
ncbi:MAG: hypothetical protein HY675_04130 [Chloroflexi bacterium]|nr:hypothetical protein [Chloroflexota bacterium]